MWHAWERRENYTSPKERDHSEDQGVDGIGIDLREIGLGVWIGLD
jgi:hypothetical protein